MRFRKPGIDLVVVEISIVPIGTPHTGLSEYVAGCLTVLNEAEGVTWQLTPMGTILEGKLDQVLKAVRRMHEQPFQKGIQRVVTTIRIDDRRDRALTMTGKVAAVKVRLDK